MVLDCLQGNSAADHHWCECHLQQSVPTYYQNVISLSQALKEQVVANKVSSRGKNVELRKSNVTLKLRSCVNNIYQYMTHGKKVAAPLILKNKCMCYFELDNILNTWWKNGELKFETYKNKLGYI